MRLSCSFRSSAKPISSLEAGSELIYRDIIMSLQRQITADLRTAMKNKDRARNDAVRVLIGEFHRQPDKELSDQQFA